MSSSLPIVIALVVYLAAGGLTAALLARQGQELGTVFSALIVWPFLLPSLLGSGGQEARTAGPCAARIDQVFDALLQTLEDPASDEVPWAHQALALREALHRADARLAFVDRLLADEDGAEGTAASLREARAHAAGEIHAVLAAVSQLRLQVGLLALAGDAVPVAAQLDALMGRATALLEVNEAGYVQASA